MIEAYTDGSFISGRVGYGAVILENGEPIHTISGEVTTPEFLSHRQVAGEIKAVEEVLSWCESKGHSSCAIYFDYQGVESWATGAWKRNKELTRSYKSFVDSKNVRVSWKKVKAHSGNKYNEEADKLAKAGCFAGSKESSETKSESNQIEQDSTKSSDLMEEAKSYAYKLIMELGKDEIEALYAGCFNNMYARVEIGSGKNRIGMVDIYNTKRKRLKPDYRGFKELVAKSIVEECWRKVEPR